MGARLAMTVGRRTLHRPWPSLLPGRPVRAVHHRHDVHFRAVGHDYVASSLSELSCQAEDLVVPVWRTWWHSGKASSCLDQVGAADLLLDGRDCAAVALILPMPTPFGAQAAAARANIRFTL